MENWREGIYLYKGTEGWKFYRPVTYGKNKF